MAKVSKALFGRLAVRCGKAGGVPSVWACAVLMSLADMEVRGEQPPRQGVWAANVGMSERALREHLAELRELGLVHWYRTAAGNEYSCNVPAVTRWVAGELDLVEATDRQMVPEGNRQDMPIGQVRDRQDMPDALGSIRRISRAGVTSSSSVSPAPAATAASLTDLANRIRQRLNRDFRIGLPAGVADEVVSRLAVGATEEMFEEAARKATLKAAHTGRANYMFVVLDGWLAEAAESGPQPSGMGEEEGDE